MIGHKNSLSILDRKLWSAGFLPDGSKNSGSTQVPWELPAAVKTLEARSRELHGSVQALSLRGFSRVRDIKVRTQAFLNLFLLAVRMRYARLGGSPLP
ncbi:MAG: hypothetical protein ACYDC6_09455, partial [Acidobacteriaceae bacterium]